MSRSNVEYFPRKNQVSIRDPIDRVNKVQIKIWNKVQKRRAKTFNGRVKYFALRSWFFEL